ncbi:hypothetical protein VHUM_02907 [Vanrija humicola]|uniref:DUF1742-domain-containing protein n=1 Tax=Vanrija humicola TaxID=5417 RepID=A0A7D8YYG3_VANHU|nr:hypothetical protein VHUM_02907 [Vanrija humicola]
MATPTPIQNIYYERKTATARGCYICHRPTQTVLATLRSEDYLYTCPGHLGDSATALASPAPGPTAEDIRKVVAEYGVREARKAEKKAEAEKDKDKDADKDKKSAFSLGGIASGGAEEVKDESKPASPAPPITANIPSSTAPTHNKYALHRSIFEARRADLIRKQQAARAKEVSKGLPQVPRGAF